MNKSWISIVVAAVFEVTWVVGLKYANTPLEWIGTACAIGLSFYLMIKAGEKIPVGTVYAVFVGLGTLGTVCVDTVVFHSPLTGAKVLLVGLLLVGVIGLKMSSQEVV